jgi:hypothetical protein|nr:MAG TPA: hypothetical protein [Caudoviricetes sp.]
MKIKITQRIPIANPPEIGSIHEVTKVDYEPPRNRRTRMYHIDCDGRDVGVYPRECEKVSEEEK